MQLPRGYHSDSTFGAWLSLVERSVRDREVVGSNPIAPTIFGMDSESRSALAFFLSQPKAAALPVCYDHGVLFTNSIFPLSVSMVPTILSPFTVTSHLSKAAVRPG